MVLNITEMSCHKIYSKKTSGWLVLLGRPSLDIHHGQIFLLFLDFESSVELKA